MHSVSHAKCGIYSKVTWMASQACRWNVNALRLWRVPGEEATPLLSDEYGQWMACALGKACGQLGKHDVPKHSSRQQRHRCQVQKTARYLDSNSTRQQRRVHMTWEAISMFSYTNCRRAMEWILTYVCFCIEVNRWPRLKARLIQTLIKLWGVMV